MSMDVDDIDAYERRGPTEDFEPIQTAYVFGKPPRLQRVVFEPSSEWSANTLTLASGIVHRVFPSGPNMIGRVTIAPQVECYVNSEQTADVSTSFRIPSGGSLSFSSSKPVFIFTTADGVVSTFLEVWTMNDDRIS